MLSVLHIENIAVIRSADIRFGRGFNALTGETGAGKSIVVDAMSAVTGERTSRELIRTGASSALVSGAFTDVRVLPWMEESGLLPDENGEMLLQREILPDGKNVCRVNSRPVTVAQLRALGRQLLNIHGQHDGQQLLDESCHLSYLDNFSKNGKSLGFYREAYNSMMEIRAKMKRFRMNESEKERKLDLLNYQILELEKAGLRAGEEAELLERRVILRSAADLTEAVEGAHYALSGDDDSAGAASLLTQAEQALGRVSGISPELDELLEKISEIQILAQDAADSTRNLLGNYDADPGELDRIEGRLDQLYRLKKKYGETEQEMLDFLEKCQNERDEIAFADEALARLEEEYKKALEEAEKRAKILSDERKEAGKLLQARIQDELAQLDMPKVRFQVEFTPLEDNIVENSGNFSEYNGEIADISDKTGLNADGMDAVRFLMSANVGEDLKPIQKIASGGELARIMLALKNVLAEGDGVDTLVFDEVDTGVSGRAAQRVAQKLCQVARGKQVLCVTHLPQIAAMADVHFSVEKGEKEGRTFTKVEELDRQRRQAELARLTSGDRITQASLDSAGELLDAAEAYKAAL